MKYFGISILIMIGIFLLDPIIKLLSAIDEDLPCVIACILFYAVIITPLVGAFMKAYVH